MSKWPLMPLGDLCLAKSGNSKIIKGTLPTENGGLLFPAYSATGQDVFSDGFDFDGDGIVISAVGARCGKCFFATGKWRAIANTHVILPKPGKADARFLWYLLNDESFWIKGGTAQPFVKVGDSLKKKIGVPLLMEQRRIVRLLDKSDELRNLRATADQRTATLVPALFNEMFGRVEFIEKTIGEFLEQGWILLHKDGNHGSLYPRSSDFGVEGIPFLSATCVTDAGTIDHSEVKRLAEEKAKLLRHGWIERGDVLLAHNASVGAVAFYEGDYDRAIIGTSLTAFRANPSRIEPRFLWAMLRDVFFQRQLERIMKQALRNQVPITAQRDLLLRIPPLAIQKEFGVRVSEIRELGAEQAGSRRRLDDLFQSMLHGAFEGEL